MRIRLGTRGSQLALAQAAMVREAMAHLGHEAEPVVIRTSGDEGKREVLGAFVREIQHAVLDGRVDAALHCLKDLPTEGVSGLELAAFLPREDPRDALVSRHGSLQGLREGAVVGTGSVRRSAQLAALRRDLRFRPLVGNVDTRLGKLVAGEYDAIVLAMAGLARLGFLERRRALPSPDLSVVPLEPGTMLPAPGQGVLVLEIASGREDVRAAVAALDESSARACASAERAFLRFFGGGCSVPIGALGSTVEGEVLLSGLVAAPDGSRVLKGERRGEPALAAEEAVRLAQELDAQGAGDLIAGVRVPVGGSA